jgi:hypothetical protein
VAKRALLRRAVPTVPGGGTILFVSPTAQSYHPDAEIREEGGTPAIVESIRAGLAFAIHRAHPIGDDWSRRMHAEARKGFLGAKLAFTRLSFPYYTSEAAFRYVLEAVHLLADEGWKLLPLYRFHPDSGLREHRGRADAAAGLERLLAAPAQRFARAPESILPVQLEAARVIIRAVGADPPAAALDDAPCSAELEQIRWFPLPGEALGARGPSRSWLRRGPRRRAVRHGVRRRRVVPGAPRDRRAAARNGRGAGKRGAR